MPIRNKPDRRLTVFARRTEPHHLDPRGVGLRQDLPRAVCMAPAVDRLHRLGLLWRLCFPFETARSLDPNRKGG